MTTVKTIEQMGLFETGEDSTAASPPPLPEMGKEEVRKQGSGKKAGSRVRSNKTTPNSPERSRKGSGLVPKGDVRLTANIREDLHLKLKISAARRRTTIGDLIEELVETHL